MKFNLSIIISYIICLLLGTEQGNAGTFLEMLHIDCDGTLAISLRKEKPKYVTKYRLGDVSRGMLYGHNFFAFDDKRVIVTDLILGKSISLLSEELLLDKNYKPWLIGYVDNQKIIFSAQRYDRYASIDKQRHHYYLYQIDRMKKAIQKIPIANCGSANFSFHDNILYYTNENGEICKYSDKQIQLLGFKGNSPTISPDGNRIAYISFGLIKYGIHVYDFHVKKKNTVIKFGEAWPIIRWSENSHFIAVKKRSDVSSNSLFLIDTLTSKNVYKFYESHACNWFFVEQSEYTDLLRSNVNK